MIEPDNLSPGRAMWWLIRLGAWFVGALVAIIAVEILLVAVIF
jgi:hypothetical protein